MTARITSWMAKLLSYAGRVQLIQSVMQGIQSFWAQLFILPKRVLKLVEALCRSYLWSGFAVITKRTLVVWEKTYLPRSAGGLNLINLPIWNVVAVCKYVWALSQHKEKLWIAWIHEYYIKDADFWSMAVPAEACWSIRKLFELRERCRYGQDWEKFETNGSYSINKAYKELRGPPLKVPWRELHCENLATPRARFISWVFMQGKLCTKDIVGSWDSSIDLLCTFCATQVETSDHLFFTCSYTQQVWSSVLIWASFNNINGPWSMIAGNVCKNVKGKTKRHKLLKMLVAETIYAVWRERNARVFQGKNSDDQWVAWLIKHTITIRMKSLPIFCGIFL